MFSRMAKRGKLGLIVVFALVISVVFLASAEVLMPEASGTKVQKDGKLLVDSSNSADGYIMVKTAQDKKRMKLTEAGFPQIVVDQTPKYLRRAKVPVVKAKIGPKVASLMCEEKIFDLIPVKKEVKAVMNGIYIIDVKGMRGGLDTKPEKKKFFARLKDKAQKAADNLDKEKKAKKK